MMTSWPKNVLQTFLWMFEILRFQVQKDMGTDTLNRINVKLLLYHAVCVKKVSWMMLLHLHNNLQANLGSRISSSSSFGVFPRRICAFKAALSVAFRNFAAEKKTQQVAKSIDQKRFQPSALNLINCRDWIIVIIGAPTNLLSFGAHSH